MHNAFLDANTYFTQWILNQSKIPTYGKKQLSATLSSSYLNFQAFINYFATKLPSLCHLVQRTCYNVSNNIGKSVF